MTADGGLITGAGKAYDSGRGLITAAGEAYDSGREAHTGAGKACDSGRGAVTADGKLITGAGKAYDSGRGAFCVSFVFFSLFFHESDSFIFLIFGPFFVVFYFSFHFCFDLPQVSNCYESDSFIF